MKFFVACVGIIVLVACTEARYRQKRDIEEKCELGQEALCKEGAVQKCECMPGETCRFKWGTINHYCQPTECESEALCKQGGVRQCNCMAGETCEFKVGTVDHYCAKDAEDKRRKRRDASLEKCELGQEAMCKKGAVEQCECMPGETCRFQWGTINHYCQPTLCKAGGMCKRAGVAQCDCMAGESCEFKVGTVDHYCSADSASAEDD